MLGKPVLCAKCHRPIQVEIATVLGNGQYSHVDCEGAADLDALRQRNEKLEAFYRAYRAWGAAQDYAASTTFATLDDMNAAYDAIHQRYQELRVAETALAAPDKEEP